MMAIDDGKKESKHWGMHMLSTSHRASRHPSPDVRSGSRDKLDRWDLTEFTLLNHMTEIHTARVGMLHSADIRVFL